MVIEGRPAAPARCGYHIENVRHPDWPVYEVIADVLGQGRTSRLYKSLVKEQTDRRAGRDLPRLPRPEATRPA